MSLNVTSRLESAHLCSGVDYTFRGLEGLTSEPMEATYMYCKTERCGGRRPCIRYAGGGGERKKHFKHVSSLLSLARIS